MATAETLSIAEESPANGIRMAFIARDVATVGGGTLLATLFNVLLIFVIPRLVRMEDYGYWRLFVLYSGYAGFLHLGLADGALLRWAGRPLEEFCPELRTSLKSLLLQHAAIIVPTALTLVMFLRPELRFVGVAVLFYTVLINATTLLQFGLQSARIFLPVAVSTAGPVGLFLLLVFLLELKRTPDFRTLILFYFIAWLAGLAYLVVRLRLGRTSESTQSTWELGRKLVLLGWPVLLVNTGMNLVQSADRLAISWHASIQDFAQYSLAASATITVVLAAVSAAYRAFYPHLAAMEHEDRRRVYVAASKLLFLCWVLLLPYYFVLELFVRRVLPQYSGTLPVAYILLLGSIFLAEILVLQASYAYVHEKQRSFLLYTLAAVVFSFAISVAMVYGTHSLRAVAGGEVVALGLWWLLNEWKLRDVTGRTLVQVAGVLGLFCWAALSYWCATRGVGTLVARVCVYYAMVGGAIWLACRAELSLGLKILTRAPLPTAY